MRKNFRTVKQKKHRKLIGQVGVDSGQLVICDPAYLEDQYKRSVSSKKDHNHEIFRHADGTLWQYTYGGEPSFPNVNPFPGSYEHPIPEYGMTPNQMIEKKIFTKTNMDPKAHIPDGEFSYRGICKLTTSEDGAGQLNYGLGHAGVGVAFSSGLGDGMYNVYATYSDCGPWGTRISKVEIELIPDAEIEEFQRER